MSFEMQDRPLGSYLKRPQGTSFEVLFLIHFNFAGHWDIKTACIVLPGKNKDLF